MGRVNWIKHQGKDILFVDLKDVQQTKVEVETANEAEQIIKSQPKGSVLTLIDYSGMHYDVDGVEAQKNYSSAVAPYVKASAAVGIDGLKKIIVRSVMRITGRNIKLFDDVEAAKDWLAAQ